MGRLARPAITVALALPAAITLTVFFLWPVAAIVARGFDAAAFGDVFASARLRQVLWFTLWQAVVSTALTILLALPLTAVVARVDFPGRRAVLAFVTVPFVLPTVVIGSAVLAVLPEGLRQGVPAVLAAHVLLNVAIVIRLVGGVWANLDARLVEAARMLGASPWRAWREITVPLLAPALAAAAALIFLFTFTSFGVVLLLGGARRATLAVEIHRQTAQLLDLEVAAALTILQLIAVTAVLVVSEVVARRTAHVLPLAARSAQRPARRATRVAAAVVVIVSVGAMALPLLRLVERSFRVGDGYGTTWWRSLDDDSGTVLFVPVAEAVRNSLVYALVTAVAATAIGAMAAFALRRVRGAGAWLGTALMLPLGTSGVVIGFGYLITLDEPPLDLRSSAALVPIAHTIVAVPFVVRAVLPVLRAIDPRLREAAAMLGASPWRTWREVDLPIVLRALAVGAGFAFAVSLGEFGATAFVARADEPTLPVAIFRLLGRPGAANYGQAMALATVLMIVTVVVLGTIERWRLGRSEF